VFPVRKPSRGTPAAQQSFLTHDSSNTLLIDDKVASPELVSNGSVAVLRPVDRNCIDLVVDRDIRDRSLWAIEARTGNA
jgi:hypothetical protein